MGLAICRKIVEAHGEAEKLEHHARNEGINDTGEMIAELKSCFDEAKVELDKIAGRG